MSPAPEALPFNRCPSSQIRRLQGRALREASYLRNIYLYSSLYNIYFIGKDEYTFAFIIHILIVLNHGLGLFSFYIHTEDI